MSVSIVVGGQYGSEGKGKVAYWWTKRMNAKAVVRVGGSNSGHTIYDGAVHQTGARHAFRSLPASCLLNGVMSVIGAGSYIDAGVLLEEIKRLGLDESMVMVDPAAVLITDECIRAEKDIAFNKRIGSTESGTGQAVLQRVGRRGDAVLAKDCGVLRAYIHDTKEYMRQLLDKGEHIIIEGTQGYGLSNIHSAAYPYCTSRDTTAAGFLSEAGLSPLDVEHVVMVLRAFPIRVAGNSGPLEDEIDWGAVTEAAHSPVPLIEKTTVTGHTRRVARFTPSIVIEAIRANNPDVIVMNHVDYIDWEGRDGAPLTERQEAFLADVEKRIGRHIGYAGNGKASVMDRGGRGDR